MIIDTDQWISTIEYAQRVGIANYQGLKPYITKGQLKAIRMGRDFFIHIDDLAKWPFPQKKKSGRPKKSKPSTKKEPKP